MAEASQATTRYRITQVGDGAVQEGGDRIKGPRGDVTTTEEQWGGSWNPGSSSTLGPIPTWPSKTF